MVASTLGAGLRPGLDGAVVLGLGIAGTVATSAVSDAELETILLPSRPPQAHRSRRSDETKVWGPREGESPPTAPAHGRTHPERNDGIGPYPGAVLTSGALPAGIGSLHCAPDESLRR